ncbi:MAG: hypothetical protein ABFS86_17835 [Planctomycetota bacterium]
MRVLPLLALVLMAAACAAGDGILSDGEILTQDRVVFGEARGAPVAEMDPEEARRRLNAAEEAFHRGEYRECLAIVRKALAEMPPMDIVGELRSLRFEAKRRLLSRQILVVKALPVRDVVPNGEPVEIDLALRNVTDVPVKVRRVVADSTPSLFFLEVTREHRDVYGNVRRDSERIRVPLEEDLVVPVGGRSTIRYREATVEPERRHRGYTLIRVTGSFRPAVLVAGEEEFYAGVPVKEATVRIFPPGYEPIAEDPLGTLGKAYGLGAREHLLIAAELVPPERRTEAVGVLVNLLSEEVRPIDVTAMAALRRLTGRNFTLRPLAWKGWWKEQQRGVD